MIIDLPRTAGGAAELTCSAPTANAQFALSSDSYDLSSGSGNNTAWLPGDGEPLYLRFEVTTAFVTANNATCNFFWCMSDASNLVSANTTVIGISGGPYITTAGFSFGMAAASMTVGASITMPLTGWDPTMYASLANFQILRYLGIGILCQNYVVPATFTAGAVRAYVTKIAERGSVQRFVFPNFKVV